MRLIFLLPLLLACSHPAPETESIDPRPYLKWLSDNYGGCGPGHRARYAAPNGSQWIQEIVPGEEKEMCNFLVSLSRVNTKTVIVAVTQVGCSAAEIPSGDTMYLEEEHGHLRVVRSVRH